jgi:hypothetical protein
MTRELRVQAGSQSAIGTGVTPTVLLRGVEEFSIQPSTDIRMLPDMSLGLSGSSQAVIGSIGAVANGNGWATYQHLPYWLDALFAEATPGAAPTYTRDYAAPTTAATAQADMRILTLVVGDGTVGGYGLTGGVVNSLTLRGEPTEPLQWTVEVLGIKAEARANASLSAGSVDTILGSQLGDMTWDTWAGTMGTTPLDDCTIRWWELSINANRSTRNCFGTTTPNDYQEEAWDGELKLSLEFNATTKTDVTSIIGGTLTQKQIQFDWTGGTNQALQIQFAGTVTEPPQLFSDEDGIVTVELTLTRSYHTTFANWLKMSIDNAVATLS